MVSTTLKTEAQKEQSDPVKGEKWGVYITWIPPIHTGKRDIRADEHLAVTSSGEVGDAQGRRTQHTPMYNAAHPAMPLIGQTPRGLVSSRRRSSSGQFVIRSL